MNNLLLLQIKLTQLQAGLVLGAALGLLLGLIPLILGIIKRKTKLGILGLIGATVGNAIMGFILSIPIIALCIYLILKKPIIKEPVEVIGVSEKPVDVSNKNPDIS